jgi:hypothetical protein
VISLTTPLRNAKNANYNDDVLNHGDPRPPPQV